MSSRDAILQRIQTALSGNPPLERPPTPDVWPDTCPTTEQLVGRFVEEIEAVAGEVYRLGSMEDARAKLAELLDELECAVLGGADHPTCRELTTDLEPGRVDWGKTDAQPKDLADLAAGLVAADYLLADTGTCMVACGTAHHRLMCYLPPVCILVAKTDRLVEHLPAAWGDVARRTADPELRGEFVFITGPSRTADIEKILILGVHGPKRLVVLLVD